MSASLSREECVALDAGDPLAALRDRFVLPAGTIYLDGNSLGAMPRHTAGTVAAAVEEEWGAGLIRSWLDAGWMDAPRRVGGKIARLIGAVEDEVIAADSTSVCLFKVIGAALAMRVDRPVLLTERENFHTDLYIAAATAQLFGRTLRVVPRAGLRSALGGDVAALLLTHVDYRTGEIHDMASLSEAAHAAGALTVWDLSHSAGAVPLHVHEDGADLATGCGYKFLNGGPGAPAYMYARAGLHGELRNPLPGWLGHARPFDFEPEFVPAAGMGSMLSGTPPILQLAALEAGVDLWLDVDATAARTKSVSLTELFIRLVEARCAGLGFTLLSPRDASRRGAQVSLAHTDGYGVVRALAEHGVIADFRAPDVCRFGFAPLYLRHVDVWDAVDRLVAVVASGAHREARFAERAAVT